jgi:hypothetical protein
MLLSTPETIQNILWQGQLELRNRNRDSKPLYFYRKFGLKPRPFRTALSYNGKSDNQAKN